MLMDAYISAYCILSQKDQRNRCLGEVFDERSDWQPTLQTQRATVGSQFITVFSVLLVAGLAYLVR